MSKLTGLHSMFGKISIYGSNMGFHALTFARPIRRRLKLRASDLVVIEGNLIIKSYMDEELRPIVMLFLCLNQCQYQA